MTSTKKRNLLSCEHLPDFLRLLRGADSAASVMRKIRPHGGPQTPQTIYTYEKGLRGISRQVQLAYALGFKLDAELRLKLQELAGHPFVEGPARLSA